MAKSRAGTDFTSRWLDRVQPPAAGRAEYWDGIVHGLGLRVSATGHKSWFALFRPDPAKPAERITLGSYPAMSLLDAREAARAKMGEAKAAAASGAVLTVAGLVKKYLAECATPELRDSSLKRVAQILRADAVAVLGERPAAELRRRDVIAWVEAIKARGAPVQANRALRVLQRVYNWAISRDLLEVNPCAQVSLPSTELLRDRVLTEDEIRALWSALEGEPPAIAAMFQLPLLTAQRGGEVRGMQWADVDMKAKVWTIPAAAAKNAREHRVPLTKPAIAILNTLPGDKGPVIPGLDPKLSLANPYKALNRLRRRSGIAFVIHDLRRTAASYMAALGVSEDDIGKVLNHAATTVTGIRYIRHPYDDEKRRALDKWAVRLMAIVGG